MAETPSNHTASDVTSVPMLLTELVQNGLLSEENRTNALAWLDQQIRTPTTPWYVKAFVGASAWLAAFFIISFLGVAGLIDNSGATIAAGAIFGVSALALKWFSRRSIFVGQLAFAFSLAGQGLLIAGIGMRTESVGIAALATLVLEALLFAAYPDPIHRFISVAAMTVALVVLLVEYELPNAVHLLVALFGAASIFVWRNEISWRASTRLEEYWSATAYGAVLSLFGLCLLPLIDPFEATRWWISTGLLALGLFYLWSEITTELAIMRQSGAALWLLVGVTLLLLPLYETPGIVAAFMALLLAFWRSNRLLLGLSSLFLLFFLGLYYYNLDFTLLKKSYILMGSGVVLLSVRFGLMRLQRREEP